MSSATFSTVAPGSDRAPSERASTKDKDTTEEMDPAARTQEFQSLAVGRPLHEDVLRAAGQHAARFRHQLHGLVRHHLLRLLETRSVVATGTIAGLFLMATALTGIWFGGLVDHHRKKTMMQMSALVSLVLYASALRCTCSLLRSDSEIPTSIVLWVFVVLLMLGVIAGTSA